jgi:tRNA U54 and U55 pseudouridine synthase Pus10
MIVANGWTAKQAAGLLCVNPTYVGLARRLNADDRLRLARGQLRLAALYQDHPQRLAEHRAQRLAAEREAQVKAEREEQFREIDHALDCCVGNYDGTVSFVDGFIERHGPRMLFEALDVNLQRRGLDIIEVAINTIGAERAMRALDAVTAPQRVAAE